MTRKPRKESYRVTITRSENLKVEHVRKMLADAVFNAYGETATVELIRKDKKQSGFWAFMTSWLAPDA